MFGRLVCHAITSMKKRTLMSWSSGKDCALALSRLLQSPEYEVVGLFCTVNRAFDRVAMHAVRSELLRKQAESIGLDLEMLDIPWPCSNHDYEEIMAAFVERVKQADIDCIAFGDLFLEDVRDYRVEKLKGSGIEPVFPIWGIPTDQVSREIIGSGFRSMLTCIDPEQLPHEFAGRFYDEALLADLPEHVDPCGERGEFHSFVFDGPIFNRPVAIAHGEIVHRDGFVFADLMMPAEA